MFNSKAIKTLFLFSLSSAAFAAPSNNAVSHFKAIGAGEVVQIMGQYTESATLHWVDGPLGYALSGEMDRQQLLHVAEIIYRGLNP